MSTIEYLFTFFFCIQIDRCTSRIMNFTFVQGWILLKSHEAWLLKP